MSELALDASEVGKGQFQAHGVKEGWIKIEVRLRDKALWLSRAQPAEQFQITQHIQHVFKEDELPVRGNSQKVLVGSQRGWARSHERSNR